MYKAQITDGYETPITLMDSITKVSKDEAGTVVVAASHGGTSCGEYALQVPLRGVFFNDAGVGKRKAGIASLAMLEKRGIPAGTVAHTSARIGDAKDMWENGVISHINASAERLGLRAGMNLKVALKQFRPE